MGNILPASVTNPNLTGPNALPNRALFNNGNINYGAAIGDIGDILRGLGGPAGSWDPILKQREAEDSVQQQRAIEAQRYQDQLRQQQFSNNLALQTLRVRMIQAMGRSQVDPNSAAGILGGSRSNIFQSAGLSTPTVSPTLSSLSELTGGAPVMSSAQSANQPTAYPITQSADAGIGINNNNINGTQASVPPNFITPDTIPETARDKYNRLAAVQPELAQELLRAANHQIPISEVTKAYKNPADAMAIRNFVPALNPQYDPKIAQNVQQFQRDINNPKSPVNVNFRSDQELANLIIQQISNAKKLPSIGFTAGNKILDKIEGAFGSQALTDYYQLADAIYKEAERGRLQGRPTVSSVKSLAPLYDASLGPTMLSRSYQTLLDGVDRRLYGQIYNATNATKGFGGYQSYHLDPNTLNRLRHKGYIRIDSNGALVPLVDPDELAKQE